jgi:peptidoglycan/xylan/chitin deacetylase (PgdA/CDA1 family)
MMFNDRIIEAARRTERNEIDLSEFRLGRRSVGNWIERRTVAEEVIVAVKHLEPDARDERVAQFESICAAPRLQGPMMSADQLRDVARAGMEVGGHTRTHPILRSLPDAASQREIRVGRAELTDIIGTAPELFAYPNGRRGADFDDRHQAMVAEAGYRFAFSTEPGAACRTSHPLALPRFSPWDRESLRFRARALSNLLKRS